MSRLHRVKELWRGEVGSSALGLLGLMVGFSSASALEVTLTRIAERTGTVGPFDFRPALQGDFAAFRGTTEGGVDGMLRQDLTTGEITAIVLDSDEVPNRQGQTFRKIDWPSIHDGTVYFTGGASIEVTHGMYGADASSVSTVLDRQSWFPSAGPLGIAFRDDQSAVTNPGAWFYPYGGTPRLLAAWGQSLPNGDVFVNCNVGETPAYGEDQVAFVATTQGDGVLLRYDVSDETLHTVADDQLQFPGTPEYMDFYRDCDTDGERIAFIATSGQVFFGGHMGVFVSDVGSGPAEGGSATMIARNGDSVPGVNATFDTFEMVAVDGPYVYFTAFWGSQGNGLFVWDGTAVHNIVDGSDVLDGDPVLFVDLTHRSIDGNRFLFRMRPEEGFDYGYYLGEIQETADVGDATEVGIEPGFTVSRNPFRNDTQMSVPARSAITFQLFDVLGRQVGARVVAPSEGRASVRWTDLVDDGSRTGMFFVSAQSAGDVYKTRVTRLR